MSSIVIRVHTGSSPVGHPKLGENMFKDKPWVPGRRDTGYFKKYLKAYEFKRMVLDFTLLKYPQGSYIPKHTDKVEGFNHYRLNIILKSGKGGKYIGKTMFNLGRIKLINAGKDEHEVTEVISGTRYVLSIGLLVANT